MFILTRLSRDGSLIAVAVCAILGSVPAFASAPELLREGVVLPVAAPPLAGHVQDETGIPLPNADVIVTEAGRTTTTNAEGNFEVRSLPAGTYHVTILHIGHTPAHVVVVLPDSGDAVRINVTLKATTVRLQGVQVTATPTGTDPLTITQSTAELSGKELNRNLGASVAQTLANEPGLAMRYNGPAANVPVIRGLTGERILVLQDGERTGDLSSTSSDHGLTIDPLTAQRIEVVRGPASLLYGNNALGGVVNVISSDIPTSVPVHIQGYIATQTESVNPGAAGSVGVSVPVGSRFVAAGRVSVRSTDDYRAGGSIRQPNTFSRNQGAVAGAGYVGDVVTGGLAYRGSRFDYGLPAPVGDAEAGVHIDGARHETLGRVDVNINRHRIETVRLNGTAQWYRHDEIEPSGEIGSAFRLRTQTVNLTARTRLAPGYGGAVGLSGLFREYSAEGEEALTPAADSRSAGIFVYQEVPLGRPNPDLAEARQPHLQFGGRFDSYRIGTVAGDSKFGPARTSTFNNVSGSLGLSVPLRSATTLSGSVARAFRAPTVEELHSNAFHAAAGTYDIGNPELRAEINTGADIVLRTQSGRASAQLSAYRNRISDYITSTIARDTVLEGEEGEPNTVPLNLFEQRDADLHGIEGQVETAFARRYVIGAVADVVRGRFTSGAPLPFLPSGRVGGSLRYDTGRYFISGDARHGFEQTRVSQAGCPAADDVVLGAGGERPTDSATGAPCVDISTPAYTVVNLSTGVTIIAGAFSHSITLRADNIADERYFDASSRIKSFTANPGRNVSLIYKVLF